MKSTRTLFFAFAFASAAVAVAACQTSDQEEPGTDAGTIPGDDAGTASDGAVVTPDGGSGDAGADAGRTPAKCLTDANFADFVVIDATFPFCVTSSYSMDAAPSAALNWGSNGFTTLNAPGTKAVSYPLPATASGKITPSESAGPIVPNTPAPCPAQGVKPDPCGAYFNGTPAGAAPLSGALWSYTSTGMTFPGEALLLSPTLTVTSRAFSNGIYSLAVVPGTIPRIVASALSPLAAARNTAKNTNGLYVSEVCAGSLVPSGACKSFALIEVGAVSGPIASDLSTYNLAAFMPDFSGIAATVQVFAFTKKDVLDATGKLTRTPLATFVADGSQSVGMIPAEAAGPGWVLNKNYDDFNTGAKAAVEGANYTINNGAFVSAGVQGKVLSHGTKADDLNLVTDAEGDLWVIVSTSDGKGQILELRRKP